MDVANTWVFKAGDGAMPPALTGRTAEEADREVDAALADAAGEDAAVRVAALEALNRLGYVWQPPDQQAPIRWQPGIPSLMAHVLKQAA